MRYLVARKLNHGSTAERVVSQAPSDFGSIVILTLVDDAFETNDTEQPAGHGRARNQTQDDDAKQAAGVGARGLLQQGVSVLVSAGRCGNRHS